MKYINEEKINNLLLEAKNADSARLEAILDKSRSLKRLTLEESASLLAVDDEQYLRRIFELSLIHI